MSSAKTLRVSFVGMQTQEVAIKPNLRVVLKSDAEVLDEVVVTAMGIYETNSFELETLKDSHILLIEVPM